MEDKPVMGASASLERATFVKQFDAAQAELQEVIERLNKSLKDFEKSANQAEACWTRMLELGPRQSNMLPVRLPPMKSYRWLNRLITNYSRRPVMVFDVGANGAYQTFTTALSKHGLRPEEQPGIITVRGRNRAESEPATSEG